MRHTINQAKPAGDTAMHYCAAPSTSRHSLSATTASCIVPPSGSPGKMFLLFFPGFGLCVVCLVWFRVNPERCSAGDPRQRLAPLPCPTNCIAGPYPCLPTVTILAPHDNGLGGGDSPAARRPLSATHRKPRDHDHWWEIVLTPDKLIGRCAWCQDDCSLDDLAGYYIHPHLGIRMCPCCAEQPLRALSARCDGMMSKNATTVCSACYEAPPANVELLVCPVGRSHVYCQVCLEHCHAREWSALSPLILAGREHEVCLTCSIILQTEVVLSRFLGSGAAELNEIGPVPPPTDWGPTHFGGRAADATVPSEQARGVIVDHATVNLRLGALPQHDFTLAGKQSYLKGYDLSGWTAITAMPHSLWIKTVDAPRVLLALRNEGHHLLPAYFGPNGPRHAREEKAKSGELPSASANHEDLLDATYHLTNKR